MIQKFIYLIRVEKDEICLSLNYMLRILDRRKWFNVQTSFYVSQKNHLEAYAKINVFSFQSPYE